MVVEGGCCFSQQSTVPNAAARAPSVPITGASGGTGELCQEPCSDNAGYPCATAASRAQGSVAEDSVAVPAQ